MAIVGGPGHDGDEVGHEGRDEALEDGSVATDDVLVVHLRPVRLVHH